MTLSQLCNARRRNQCVIWLSSKIQTWDWMTNEKYTKERGIPDHDFSATVDGRSYHGDTLEEAVKNVRNPTPTEKAAELRAQAQKNLDEAAALEAAQPEVPHV